MNPDFRDRAKVALADGQIRKNFRRAMDGLMAKRQQVFSDPIEFAQLRQRGFAIKARALAKLPDLLEQLEKNCQSNGINVHWAETTTDANRIVLDIIERHNAKRVIKGKSMVSEEMELNHFLEEHDKEIIETDLGEYIVQLAGETPSHIIMPAIHKNTGQIAQLFKEKIRNAKYTEDVDQLTATAREILREKFRNAEIGVTGVNFAVAETGTLCLVENEGNGRMSSTAPPVHIAVTGIEKVVEKFSDLPTLLSLLTRSATGQTITTYFNMISSPRKENEVDGPEEVHLVLLDNGRSRIYADAQLQESLRCIRCGTCMNHCPVYTKIGGHAYGTVYPGPIGKVIEPQIRGLSSFGELADASTLCGACAEVCPVMIPLPDLLVRLRTEGVGQGSAAVVGAGARRTLSESLIWKLWRLVVTRPALYRIATGVVAKMPWLFKSNLGGLDRWKSVRTVPKPAPQTLHQSMAERGSKND